MSWLHLATRPFPWIGLDLVDINRTIELLVLTFYIMNSDAEAVKLIEEAEECEALNYEFSPNRVPSKFTIPKSFIVFVFLWFCLLGYYSFSNGVLVKGISEVFYADAKSYNSVLKDVGFFIRPAMTQNLSCQQYFEKPPKKWVKEDRIVLESDPDDLNMTCEAIKTRNYFPNHAYSAAEALFPIAYARIVYKNYLFHEMELSATYSPQNAYCFAIDSKANETFKIRMHALSNCLPNVIIADNEYDVDSAGHNMNRVHLSCLQKLSKYNWRYVFLLQNFDAAIKTNAEMVQILHWYDGANDVEVSPMLSGRVNYSLDWRLGNLGLYKNSSLNMINSQNVNISFAKGLNQCSLSREMVDVVLNDFNLTKMMNYLDSMSYGVDETLFPTLNAMDFLKVPGGFTTKCIKERISVETMTRRSNWVWSAADKCKSGIIRHNICILGVENLKELTKWPQLFANKFQPSKDFGAYVCWREWMFNRGNDPDGQVPEKVLNRTFYESSLLVRFQKESRKSGFNVNEFKCR
uniref:Nucleotid_trans domain-containing protein n=1 Tax=Panagrellus redivivus TaxID=6233 RepID=A0A7E4VIZ7_PANRE